MAGFYFNVDTAIAQYLLLLKCGKPELVRSNNGSEFIAAPLQEVLPRIGTKLIQIYPGPPWENGYNEQFNATLRNRVLNAEWLSITDQAQIVISCTITYDPTKPLVCAHQHRKPFLETSQAWPKSGGLFRPSRVDNLCRFNLGQDVEGEYRVLPHSQIVARLFGA